jgi:hypothetical protein
LTEYKLRKEFPKNVPVVSRGLNMIHPEIVLFNPPTAMASLPIPEPPKPKLLDQLREIIRLKHYSIRTEQSYVDWAKRYILFHGKKHPKDMGAKEISAFLTHLAVDKTCPPAHKIKRLMP